MAVPVVGRFAIRGSRAVNDTIPFIDLQAQRKRLGRAMEKAILAAVEGGQWILGPQVSELEQRLARFAGVKHAIACANGTDALLLILKAWGVGPGDAVFVPAFTFAATAEVVALAGATPVFVDVLPDSYNMDPASLESAVAFVRRDTNLRPQVVIAVDLFGQPADYRKLTALTATAESAVAVRFGAIFRRDTGRSQYGCFRACRRDELFPGEAAWLLWRWRSVLHR